MKKQPDAGVEPHVFDQTNGLADLRPEPGAPDLEEDRKRARRLISTAAQVMAYGQRHS